MWVTLHALALVLLPLLTIAAIRNSPKKPDRGEAAAAIVVGFLMALLFGFSIGCCIEPPPWRQFLIPTLCATSAIAFIRSSPLSGAVTLSSLALAAILSGHANHLRGVNQWTGLPNLANRSASLEKSQLDSARRLLDAVSDSANYRPCWLREHPNEQIAMAGMANPPPDSWAEPAWHTWLTGLYHRHDIDRDFWYPGGKLADAVDKIELRPRLDVSDAIERQYVALQQEQNRIAKLHWNDRALADESVLAANLLGEYAWSHGGRLPETWQQLIESGLAGSAADGAVFVGHSGTRILNPNRYRWTPNGVVPPLKATPQASPTSSAADRLIWTADNTLNADQIEGLVYRIQWVRTNGRVGQ